LKIDLPSLEEYIFERNPFFLVASCCSSNRDWIFTMLDVGEKESILVTKFGFGLFDIFFSYSRQKSCSITLLRLLRVAACIRMK